MSAGTQKWFNNDQKKEKNKKKKENFPETKTSRWWFRKMDAARPIKW